MSVEIPMDDPICGPPLAGAGSDAREAPAATANPVHVMISPIGDVDDAAPAAYTGVLYLHHHNAAAAAALGQPQRQQEEPGKKRGKWLMDMRGWLMVLALLAAAAAYQVGLNPPGGFWQNDGEGYVAGTPVLQSMFPKRYNVFVYFNATAFLTSVVIIIMLMNESLYQSEVKVVALKIIVVVDMVGLMGAYIAGSTRTASSSIYVTVLAAVVFLYVVYTAQLLKKLWWLLMDVPCADEEATAGGEPVPHLDRTKSASPELPPLSQGTPRISGSH